MLTFSAPEWLQSHPAVKSRGIVLEDPMKPFCVWRTTQLRPVVPYAIKILDVEGREANFYSQLHSLSVCKPNHTLPCDIISSERQILIMPCLFSVLEAPRKWDLPILFDFFYQVTEGLEFLHSLNIAHMDLYLANIIIATEDHACIFKEIEADKVYIIDFDRSRRLELGPGKQHAIELPETHEMPPLDMKRFDPYSWDVYCLGKTFQYLLHHEWRDQEPWIARVFVNRLIGKERGCTTVCHCRPSARRARLVASILLWVVRIGNFGSRAVGYFRGLVQSHAKGD